VVTITQQPQSVTVAANSPQTFTVVAQTASPYSTTVLHQWYRNGAAILGATGTSYTIPFVPAAENGAKYTVRVAVLGKYVLSSEATLTVTDDITPPTIGVGGVHGTQDLSHVTVQFSEPVTDPSATTAGNYTMTPALAVTAATRVNATTVQLTTATQTQNTKYTLTVNNVKDVAGLAIAANTKVDWMSWVVPGTVGPITVEIYDGAGGATAGAITGTTVADLLAWGGYPASPDVTTTITGSWNSRLFYADDTHENFGARMTGLITPSETGDYRFFVYSDDSSQLWLSTDTTEAKLVKIAEETGCCEAFREPPSEQVSAPIHLIAGTSYLMRGIYKEGGGGDYMQVAWRKEGNPIPASALTPMPGVFDPWGGAPATGLKGADFEAGGTATLSVEGALGLRPLSYKWQKTGPADSHTDIAGATSATLTIPNASLADVGAYRCLITNPAGTTTTREVVLTLKKSFLIEAEDFDYNGGQHQAVADTMPYAGFAYDGLSAKYDVDYHNDNNDSITYRRGGDLAVAGHGASMDNSTGNVLSLQRGAWDVVNNYKIGWINGGDWHNYTRAIPAGSYTAFAALSYGDTSATGLKATLNKVTAGVGTTTQTLEALGGFDQAGSGAWGRNSLVALKDGTGAAAVFNIAGPVTTLRMSHTSGDFDWLMLVPFAEAEDIQIDVKLNADGTITIAWNGGGVLQAATSLLGPWQDVTSTSPYTFAPQAGVPYMFGRIKK
jgi:hypothetical protein